MGGMIVHRVTGSAPLAPGLHARTSHSNRTSFFHRVGSDRTALPVSSRSSFPISPRPSRRNGLRACAIAASYHHQGSLRKESSYETA